MTRSGPTTDATPGRPRFPVNRVVILAVATTALALALQLGMIALGLGRNNPFRLLLVPIIGALIVYFGLSGYSKAGRVRLSIMVGIFLLLFAGTT